MKIFIDIGHPAHVHYFRNFITIMHQKGHLCFISARNRNIIQYLLNQYKIKYYNRGEGKNSIIGKLIYMLFADFKLLRKAISFKPDIFISFASPYAAQVSWIMRKPHIVMDDTEHAKFGHIFYKPFSSVLLNPSCFKKDFGRKQLKFNSYAELMYLHPNYFKADENIWDFLGIQKGEKFVLLRFVSWEAHHDIGHSGIDLHIKKELVSSIVKRGYKVFISSEKRITDSFFENHLLKIPPEYIHSAMKYASLMITEGATMASECAMLGCPSIYVNSLDAGTLREQEDKYQAIFGFRSSKGLIKMVNDLLDMPQLKEEFEKRSQKILLDKEDPTKMLVWLVENYPTSVLSYKQNGERAVNELT